MEHKSQHEVLTSHYCKELPPLRSNENFISEYSGNIIVKQSDELQGLLIDPEVPTLVHSDIWLLQNLNRLNYSDPTALAAMVHERFKSRGNDVATRGMSDENIMNTIKSRNIQTLSELNSWIDYIDKSQLRLDGEITRLNTLAPDPVSTPDPSPTSVE